MYRPSTRRRLYVILLQALCLPRTRSVRGTAFQFPVQYQYAGIHADQPRAVDVRGFIRSGMGMAASMSMILRVVLLFFFAQRYFIQGVTLTGLKG